MSLYILLDSSPLGELAKPNRSAEVVAIFGVRSLKLEEQPRRPYLASPLPGSATRSP